MTAKEKVKNVKDRYKTAKRKVGKYNIGAPGSDSYKAQTPKKLKFISEGLIAVGSIIGVLTLPFHWPASIAAIGSSLVIAGRFGIKCFSNGNKE